MTGYIDPFRRGSRLADVLAARVQPIQPALRAADSDAVVPEEIAPAFTPGVPPPEEATGVREKLPVTATPIYQLRANQQFARLARHLAGAV